MIEIEPAVENTDDVTILETFEVCFFSAVKSAFKPNPAADYS